MSLSALLLCLAPAAPATIKVPDPEPRSELFAIRVKRAATITQGSIEHAVIVVEDGKIVQVGEDLPIERGIRIIDRPDWVVIPGLVNCWSRAGLDSRGGSNTFEPQLMASGELYWRQDIWQELLDAGVTTLGLIPAGTGLPGQAVAVRPQGNSKEEMILVDGVFIKGNMSSSPSAKKVFRKAFEAADKYDEKEKKAREKWEKDQEKKKKKKKKSSKKKKDDEDDKDDEKKKEDKAAAADDEKKSESDSDVYTPPEPDENVAPILALRAGDQKAVIEIRRASDWLHILDVMEDEDVTWDLMVNVIRDNDVWVVAEGIGAAGMRVILQPRVTNRSHTRRELVLPHLLHEAGAKVALTPRSDSATSAEDWREDVAELVARGLDPEVALRAMTLEPAAVLGLEERLGSIDAGKDANFVFLSGDPFEPETQIEAVMLEGKFVSGEAE